MTLAGNERKEPAMETGAPITNADRAERARQALATYNDEWDMAANSIDLLADLQHYFRAAYAVGTSRRTFDEALEMARQHFNTEVAGEELA
jgi:hypothetical protein